MIGAMQMYLAGVPVSMAMVLQLARRLRNVELDVTAEKLERAWAAEARLLALERDDRHALLRVMEDWCPPALGELRSTIVQEEVWRQTEGL